MSDDHDNPWKEVFELFLPQGMLFLFPHIHALIDWSRGFTVIKNELPFPI